VNENRKRHYPADRNKLHELCNRLEAEIAERQERLAEVRKLAIAADNAAIVNTVKTFNVTPEEFAQLVQEMRLRNPNIDLPAKPELGKRKKEEKKDGSFEPEEIENE